MKTLFFNITQKGGLDMKNQFNIMLFNVFIYLVILLLSVPVLAQKNSNLNDQSFYSFGKKYFVRLVIEKGEWSYQNISWIKIYNNNHKLIKEFELGPVDQLSIVQNFFAEKNDALLVTGESTGSGSYITWWLIGRVAKDFDIIFEKDGVFMGGAFSENKAIKEWRSNQCTLYIWNGKNIQEKDCANTKDINDPDIELVEYTIDADENVKIISEIDHTSIIEEVEYGIAFSLVPCLNLKPGMKFALVRKNKGPAERIMHFPSKSAVIEPSGAGWIAKNKGETVIKIVPGGYNWDKALIIKIIVE
ncbi:hypothetical protein ACFLZ9_01890 [Patescibacteria group bacterium]